MKFELLYKNVVLRGSWFGHMLRLSVTEITHTAAVHVVRIVPRCAYAACSAWAASNEDRRSMFRGSSSDLSHWIDPRLQLSLGSSIVSEGGGKEVCQAVDRLDGGLAGPMGWVFERLVYAKRHTDSISQKFPH